MKRTLSFVSVSAQDTGLYRCVASCYNLTLSSPPARLGTFENTSLVDEKLSEIFVYPNPGSDMLYVQGVTSPYHITLIDYNGREFKLEKAAENTFKLPENITQGVYFVRIVSGNRSYFLKYVKKD